MDDVSTLDDFRRMQKSEFYLFGTLCFVNVINYMDRVGIASILVDIQKYFSIGDDLGGLLQTCLLAAYTISAPIFGYCGDRYSRKYIIIVCISLWSISTLAGAFGRNYIVLVISRVLVGIGQSGFTTISPTVISDVALRGARTVLLACYFLGIPIGAGLGYVAVAFVANWSNSWSYGLCVGPCFCIVGILLMCFASFPKRGEKEATENGAAPLSATSYKRDIIYLGSVPSFGFVTLAFTQICFYVGALSWWTPKLLFHGFHLIPNGSEVDSEHVAFTFGAVTLVTGILGVVIGVALSRLLRPRFIRADPIICGVSLVVALPFIISALCTIAVSRVLAFSLIFFSELNMNLNWALETDILLYTIIPTRRTSAQGMSMLFSHAFGDCISPYIIGSMSQYFKTHYRFTNGSFFLPFVREHVSDPNSHAQSFHALQLSLFTVAVVLVIGALCFFATALYIEQDIKNVEKALAAKEDTK